MNDDFTGVMIAISAVMSILVFGTTCRDIRDAKESSPYQYEIVIDRDKYYTESYEIDSGVIEFIDHKGKPVKSNTFIIKSNDLYKPQNDDSVIYDGGPE